MNVPFRPTAGRAVSIQTLARIKFDEADGDLDKAAKAFVESIAGNQRLQSDLIAYAAFELMDEERLGAGIS